MPFAPVRYALKYQADAWQQFFKGQGGRPRFKRRGDDAVTIPDNVRIRDGRLYFPRLSWMTLRRRGGNPYPDGVPKSVAIKRVCGKWYAVVCYEVAVPGRNDDGEVVGVDMNVRQVTASDGGSSMRRTPGGLKPARSGMPIGWRGRGVAPAGANGPVSGLPECNGASQWPAGTGSIMSLAASPGAPEPSRSKTSRRGT